MQITFDTSNPQDLALINKIIAFAHGVEAQPQVAQNSGTTATGSTLSPEGSGVDTGAAQAAAPVTEKKPRAKKSVAATATAGSEETQTSDPVAAQQESDVGASTSTKPASLDEVRAALQAFTAKSGVPAGIELLKKYNAARISELEEQHYGAFIADCA